jgi:hypothetical protein
MMQKYLSLWTKSLFMQRITLEIEKADDLELLLLLIRRMGISIVPPLAPTPVQIKKDRQWHLQVVAKGGLVTELK